MGGTRGESSYAPGLSPARLGRAWREAAQQLGVATLVLEGADAEGAAAAYEAGRAYFALEPRLKGCPGCSRRNITEGFQRGYIPFAAESGLAAVREVKEGFCYGLEWPAGRQQRHPFQAANVWPPVEALERLGASWREAMDGFLDLSVRAARRAPPPRACCFRLEQVFRLRGPSLGGGDWSYTHTAVGPDYQESPARRLALGDAPTLDDLSDVPFGSYLTPRERVRAFVALNAGVLSPATYNITQRLQDWGLVYDQAQQFFVPEAELNETGDNLSLLRAETEVEALTDEASQIRATAAEVDDAAFAEHFRGARGPECDGSGDGTAPCLGDHGAAMSVYEDAKNKVLVFHGSWDPSEYNYMMWAHKVWVLERFERALNIMWSIQAEQEATAEMAERSYGAYVEGQYEGAEDEKVIRCAFHDFEYKPAPDADAVALATQLLGSDIIASGFWEMVKEIVRQVIPEGGELFKTVYLTGSGRGGTFAALVSMWLKRLDATALSTYVFAPDGGWQCLARRLYARDITAHDDHSHILVYSHIMDAYAGALDKVAGQVCLYGFRNFTGAVQRFCSKIVGHTGPQLLFRGESGPPEPDPAVKKARRYFDACHYFTHSVWYAAILLLDDDVLDLSGATDGGCQTVASVPRDDAMEECPLSSPAEVDCQLAAVTGQGLPMQARAAREYGRLAPRRRGVCPGAGPGVPGELESADVGLPALSECRDRVRWAHSDGVRSNARVVSTRTCQNGGWR
ncbi:unnamed protein product [Prorocentrum cordatum]|uniref:Uncharacterized protein n=1 Tax=Prorocentrum cordatum TaxID=2364126 RepID=A0ABN9TJ18_9DINO|nr:unnamed protein product [Polarella glacialis]